MTAAAADLTNPQRCGETHESACVPRTRQEGLGGRTKARGDRRHGRYRAGRRHDDLRTDLHILKGDIPAVTDGRILGHEAVGTVESVGSGVKTSRPATASSSRVSPRAAPAGTVATATPGMSRRGRLDPRPHDRRHPGRVRPGAVRRHLHLPAPAGASDEEILMLADFLHRLRSRRAQRRVQPGDVVAIVGAGPIGLSAITGSRLFTPSHIVAIDQADSAWRRRRSSARTSPSTTAARTRWR